MKKPVTRFYTQKEIISGDIIVPPGSLVEKQKTNLGEVYLKITSIQQTGMRTEHTVSQETDIERIWEQTSLQQPEDGMVTLYHTGIFIEFKGNGEVKVKKEQHQAFEYSDHYTVPQGILSVFNIPLVNQNYPKDILDKAFTHTAFGRIETRIWTLEENYNLIWEALQSSMRKEISQLHHILMEGYSKILEMSGLN